MGKKFSRQYRNYLKSDAWKRKRQEALSHYGNECQVGRRARNEGFYPNCKGALHVHHKHYRNLGNERMEDLTVLCRKHHKRKHTVKDHAAIIKALRDS